MEPIKLAVEVIKLAVEVMKLAAEAIKFAADPVKSVTALINFAPKKSYMIKRNKNFFHLLWNNLFFYFLLF